MMNFMKSNIDIKNITIACYVGEGMGEPVHKNRGFHGLVMQTSEVPNIYKFEGGKTIEHKKNEIIYLPKGSNYVVTSEVYGKGACYAINFQIRNSGTFEPFKLKLKNSSKILERFKTAEQSWKNKPYNYEMKCKAELYNIIFAMQQDFRLGYLGREKEKLIQPALEYIHNRYTTEIISIEHLGKLCSVTPTYLRQLFKKLYGVSPVKYINKLKIERSKELMGSGIYSISEAAFMSGFSDISHFSREFKKWENVTPTQYVAGEMN